MWISGRRGGGVGFGRQRGRVPMASGRDGDGDEGWAEFQGWPVLLHSQTPLLGSKFLSLG